MTAYLRNMPRFPCSDHVAGCVAPARHMIGSATHPVTPMPGWERGLVWSGIGLAILGGYVIAQIFWPLSKCRKCEGGGKFRSPSGKAWRRCPRCKGTGERIRIGRRIYGYYARGAKDV